MAVSTMMVNTMTVSTWVRLMTATAAFAAAMCLYVPASYAFGDAPWCAVVTTDMEGVHWDCQYRSFEDCAPHVVAGDRGFCDQNPWPGPATPLAAAKPSHKKRHTAQQ
jgi:hypothetical protein